MNKIFVSILLLLTCIGCRQNHTVASLIGTENNYDTILAQARVISDSNKLFSSLKYVDSAYNNIENISEEGLMKKYLHFCNIYYNGLHNYYKTMVYADSMLYIIKKTNSHNFTEKYYATANYSKGDAYYGAKNYEEAFRYYYLAKKIAGKYVNPCSLSDYTYRLGMVMFRQEHYEQAASYFKDSWKQSASCDANFYSFYRQQELLDNIGLSYAGYLQYDSALVYYQNAIRYINNNAVLAKTKPTTLDIARAVVYNNMAELYSLQNKFDLADSLYKKSIAINERQGYANEHAQVARLHLAALYLDNGKNESVLSILNSLRLSLDTTKNGDAELLWNELMWKYYKQVNEPGLAFKYLHKYVMFKDSIDNKNKVFREMDVSGQLASLEAQNEFDLLKKSYSTQSILLIVFILLVIMTMVITALVYSNNRRDKNNIQKLTFLNDQVNNQKIELEKAMTELEKRGQEKDRILRVVAHDLRTPLSGIVGLSNIMIVSGEKNEDDKHILNLVQNTANDTLQLINEILEVAGVAEVKVTDKKLTNIKEVLINTVELLKFRAAEKNQKIVLDADSSAVQIPIQKEKVARVLTNLIINAIKFSPSGEAINVSAVPIDGKIHITISDKGIGIPDEMKDKIFNVFTTAKRPGTQGEKSFGLGLSISKQIVESHNGKIWFDSSENMGTTFHLLL